MDELLAPSASPALTTEPTPRQCLRWFQLFDTCLEKIDVDGFAVIPRVFNSSQIDAMLAGLHAIFDTQSLSVAIRSDAGSVYAARNVLSLWPTAADAWRAPPLPETLAAILGPEFGLVRALFFDKPPDRNWALPWHRDLTIAVRDNRLPSRLFGKPTVKAGVPHVEAPCDVLDDMLTMRIHLDDVTEENGPLKVIPGSHRGDDCPSLGETAAVGRSILVNRGDVLLMRPRLLHGSNHSHPETRRHRRILHLEFAATAELPDGYTWHTFVGVTP